MLWKMTNPKKTKLTEYYNSECYHIAHIKYLSFAGLNLEVLRFYLLCILELQILENRLNWPRGGRARYFEREVYLPNPLRGSSTSCDFLSIWTSSALSKKNFYGHFWTGKFFRSLTHKWIPPWKISTLERLPHSQGRLLPSTVFWFEQELNYCCLKNLANVGENLRTESVSIRAKSHG